MKRRALVSFVSLGLSLPVFARANQGGEWRPLAGMNLARQEVGAARIGDFVYVVGGLVANPLGATATVEVYDIANDRWDFAASMPIALDHMAVAAAGGLLYVMGGFSGDFVPRAGAHVYDPALNQWSPVSSLPEARGGCWAVGHGGRIYLFGGMGPQGNSTSTFIYDPSMNQWTQGRDMPTARNHLVAVGLGEYIYVLGGRSPVTTANERYDPARNEWTAMAPMPTARAAMAAAAIGNRLIVAGGETPVLHAVNEIYDVATNSWACAAPMAIPRHGIAAISLDDRMLTPAGGIVQGLSPTAAVDSFIPPAALPPVVFSVKRAGSEVGRLTIERFAGRFFATVTRNSLIRCENVLVSIGAPGVASFLCGGTLVTVRRQGIELIWEAGGQSGTLCRLPG